MKKIALLLLSFFLIGWTGNNFFIGNQEIKSARNDNGVHLPFVMTYNVDCTGGCAIGTHNLKPKIPANAYIRDAFFYVKTGLASVTNAAKVKFAINNTAITNYDTLNALTGYYNTVGGHQTYISDNGTVNLTTTADSVVSLIVGDEALTAGQVSLFIEYILKGF
jgi:hypothetical protein